MLFLFVALPVFLPERDDDARPPVPDHAHGHPAFEGWVGMWPGSLSLDTGVPEEVSRHCDTCADDTCRKRDRDTNRGRAFVQGRRIRPYEYKKKGTFFYRAQGAYTKPLGAEVRWK